MVRDTGFEPVTPSVSRKCSTTELTAQPETTGAGLHGARVTAIILEESGAGRKAIL